MATAQMHRSAVSTVVIPNSVATEQQSLVLVKRLLAVSVSCITYLRGLFPEYAYGTRYLEDICVKILREDKSCPGSTQLVKWMLGSYDALQKKYLRMVVLAIYTNMEEPQTVTECYQFKFKYTPNGPIMDFTSNKDNNTSACLDVKKASVMLVRKLYVLMQNLGPLPNDVCLTMKLFYYDEGPSTFQDPDNQQLKKPAATVTPVDYQPPGFKEGSCDQMMFEGDPIYLNVGEVTTPFHVLKVRVTTEKERMENIGKTVLKSAENKSPTKAICLNVEEAQYPDSSVESLCGEADVEKNDVESLNVDELSLNCQENESMTSDDRNKEQSQTLLANTSSATAVRKTRSGRIIKDKNPAPFPDKIQTRTSKRRKKPNTDTQSQLLDLSGSQDEPTASKRRKFSEPKDPL